MPSPVRPEPDEPDDPEVKQLETAIAAAAAARAKAREHQQATTDAVKRDVYAGNRRGLSVNKLAQLAGVQRPQLRTWLDEPHSVKVPRGWSESAFAQTRPAREQARAEVKRTTAELIALVVEGERLGLSQSRMARLCELDPAAIRTWLGRRQHNYP